MKSRIVVGTLAALLAIGARCTVAQDSPSPKNSSHQTYRLIDLGTLGGQVDFFNFTGAPNVLLSNRGTVVGSSDTTIVDPYCFGNPDCFVEHAFQWSNGVLSDLGALPGGVNSNAFAINSRGVIAGLAQNGAIDPLLLSSPPPWGVQVMHAVTWQDGHITDLGTLGGYLSVAQAINDRGQVVGLALNDIPDPVSAFGLFVGTQMRAFLWLSGVMQDLGTLGGPDAWADAVNERGQVAGIAFTNAVINPITGVPTTDPFLWANGTMQDLGTLGGAYGFANALNNQGQVVGFSDLTGDLTLHPFSWTSSGGMKDLGTLGGDNGQATALNDAGYVVGVADLPGSQRHDAFLWRNGVLLDLGNLGRSSFAHAINSSGQIVGSSRIDATTISAFLWENGGPLVDLNTLITSSSGAHVDGMDAYINDLGEILASGTTQNGDVHAFLLIPDGDCDDDCQARVAQSQAEAELRRRAFALTTQHSEPPLSPAERVRSIMRERMGMNGQERLQRN